MTFIGGPCTSGPGAVVGLSYKESSMRSFLDIKKGNAPFMAKAKAVCAGRVPVSCPVGASTVYVYLDVLGLIREVAVLSDPNSTMMSCVRTP